MALPNKLIMIPNPDKNFHEKWYRGRNMLNIPHPFRAVLLGPPNTGKTLTVKNMILRQHPPFQQIYVIHCDAEYTHEYDDVEAEYLSVIPAPEEWEGKVKTLVVLDDLEVKMLQKDQKRALDRLFGFVSTHKNISVCLCSQDPFNVPCIVRRCSNLWVLWRCDDIDSLAACSRKTGFRSNDLKEIFDEAMENRNDSLWIDKTDNTPYPLRKNGFNVITANHISVD